MDLPRDSIVGTARSGVNESTRWFVALVCAASAGVHAALVPEHLRESPVLGWAFVLSVVLLAAAAVQVTADPDVAPRGVAAVLWAVAAGYLLSRTTGMPVLVPDPEPVDVLGVLTTLAEVAAGLAVLSLPRFGKEPR